MIISHVSLRNWRNFRKVDVELQDRVFIIGPNASGKSNFLDVFKFLRDISKQRGGGLQKAIQDRGGVSKIRCLAARREPNIEIQIGLAEAPGEKPLWRYEIGIKQETRGNRFPYLEYERAWKNDKLLVNRPNENDFSDPLLRTQTHLEQLTANAQLRDIATFLDDIEYLHLVPQLLKHSRSFSGVEIAGDPFGQHILESIARANDKTRTSRLKKIERALRLAVPQLTELKFRRDETGLPHLEALYQHWRPGGAYQQEDQFSDGTLRLLGLLWSLLEGASMLLLEEPELSLNAGIVRKLPSLIHRMQMDRKGQVMLSTHSADLLFDRGIALEEILILTPSPEGTDVRPASSIKEARLLVESGQTIGEVLMPGTIPRDINQLELSLSNGDPHSHQSRR